MKMNGLTVIALGALLAPTLLAQPMTAKFSVQSQAGHATIRDAERFDTTSAAALSRIELRTGTSKAKVRDWTITGQAIMVPDAADAAFSYDAAGTAEVHIGKTRYTEPARARVTVVTSRGKVERVIASVSVPSLGVFSTP